MAFSWSLAATETISGDIGKETKLTTNSAGTTVYFMTDATDEIYSWDGTTLTDLGFKDFFDGEYTAQSGDGLYDLQWFGSTLYSAHNAYNPVALKITARIGKWNGGTSWSEVTELVPEDANPRSFDGLSNAKQRHRYLEADSNRIVAVTGNSFFARLFGSTDGTTWTLQTEGGAGSEAEGYYWQAGNKSIRTRGLVVAENQDSPVTEWREIEHSGTGAEWDFLSGSSHGNHFLGYLDGKSFYQHVSGSDFTARFSTNWGLTLTAAGGPTATATDDLIMVDLHTDVQILAEKNSGDVYVWNSVTNNWDLDSTISGLGVDAHGFFVINNTLYAICEDGSSNEALFYGGGAVAATTTAPRFYYGVNELVETATLPFTSGINWGAMALTTLDEIVVGSKTAGDPIMTARLRQTDDFTTYEDITTGIPTTYSIKTIRNV